MKNLGSGLMKPLAVLAVLCTLAFPLQAQNSGPFCANRIYNSSENGSTKSWYDPGLARCDDDASYATTDLLNNGQISSYIIFENFGLSVPQEATVEGIEVVVIRRSHQAARLADRSVRLIRNGRMVGQDQRSSEPWDKNWEAAYYGGEDHTWGTAWAPTLVNSPNFGVAISVEQLGGSSRAEIDEVLVTVYYTENGAFGSSNILRACLHGPN